MAYLFTYSVTAKWITANGVGMNATPQPQGVAGPVNGQELMLFASAPVGSGTFTATDIANFVAAANTDMTAQLTANLTRISNFSTGTD
jgi:hypothetical protein